MRDIKAIRLQVFSFLALVAIAISPAHAAESPLLLLRTDKPSNTNKVARFAISNKDLRGWDYIADRMIDYGVDPDRVISIFSDSRIPRHEYLYFNPRPKESRALYRGHNTRATRKNALAFYQIHEVDFVKAEQLYNVPKEILLSILQIETRCGAYTGKHSVFYRLARLASAADPKNIAKNQKRLRGRFTGVSPFEIAKRAHWLEDTFLPHALATISLADRLGEDPLEIKGSNSGAVGLPQFLPGNIELHGSDANHDGRVDLFEPSDAIHSVARFLANHGWTPTTIHPVAQKKVILNYNRSESYANTVLAMARKLQPQL